MDQLKGPIDRLSFHLYQAASEVLRHSPDTAEQHISFSLGVFSAATVAGLLYSGSSGGTEDKLHRALHLRKIFDGRVTRELVMLAFRQAIATLTKRLDKRHTLDEKALYSGFQVYLANKVFLRTGTECRNEFRTNALQCFDMEIDELGRKFRDADETRKEINDWVRVHTNGQITEDVLPQIVLEHLLSPGTNMFLINNTCLRGRWDKPFPLAHTKPRMFSSRDGTSTLTDMMNITGNFPYVEDTETGMQYLELPFADREATMCFILPKGNKKKMMSMVLNLEKTFEFDSITRLSKHKRLRKVAVTLPKFRIESSFDLKQLFNKSGMKSAFESDADYSNIVDSPGLELTSVFHKVTIGIDEHGAGSNNMSTDSDSDHEILSSLEIPVQDGEHRQRSRNNSGTSTSSGGLLVPDAMRVRANSGSSNTGNRSRRGSTVIAWEDAIQPTVTETVEFTADRPFLFSVRHSLSGLMLFVGRVSCVAPSQPRNLANLLIASRDDAASYLVSPRFLRKMAGVSFGDPPVVGHRTRRPSE